MRRIVLAGSAGNHIPATVGLTFISYRGFKNVLSAQFIFFGVFLKEREGRLQEFLYQVLDKLHVSVTLNLLDAGNVLFEVVLK